jgi:hypothetical protein
MPETRRYETGLETPLTLLLGGEEARGHVTFTRSEGPYAAEFAIDGRDTAARLRLEGRFAHVRPE